MNVGIIMYTLGIVLNTEAIAMLLPLLCAVVYKEWQSANIFGICIIICAVVGSLMRIKKPTKKSMYAKEGFAIVALSWIIMSIFGALPFWMSGSIKSFIDALFETVSGFTTTGASILEDIEALPRSMLFWRSFTHFMGGMGVLVFLVAILPMSGGENLYLMKAESPGPSVSKLVPKVMSTAKILYVIYIVLTVLEAIFLLFGGMSLFEAVTTAVGTAGTGGFAVVNTSMMEYSSYIQVVVTVFMILFGIDFSLYYLILMGRAKEAFASEELRCYIGIILVSALVIAFNVRGYFVSAGEALKHSFFQVGAVITTTGFSTYDFDKWPELSKTILVCLMFVGACAGSTGGGMKVSRILILLKSVLKEIKIAAHPRRTYKLTLNKKLVEHETVRAVNMYFGAYFMIFVVSLLLISLDNYDFTTNFTSVATMINNIGPGLNKTGPTCNFSFFSPLSKIVMIFDMLSGRLEIFPILILFSKNAWRK